MNTTLRVGIITASDRSYKGLREDQSGKILKSLVENFFGAVVFYEVLPDEKEILKKAFLNLMDQHACDLILTTGGTGLNPRDVTPEATREVIEREIPGIPQALREASLRKTPFAMLSRGIAGVRGQTLLINFPGSPEAVRDCFDVLHPILIHALKLIWGEVKDCHTQRREAWK